MKYFSTASLFFLFITFRLMSLLLYAPGGLLGVGEPYAGLLMLGGDGLGGLSDPLLRQLVGGALLLGFDIGTLWLLLELLRRDNREEEARRRALLWAASPLPLWAWLTGGVPLITFLLLAAYWATGLRRQSWLWAALPLAFATLIEGASAELTALLLPFILLLLPQPMTSSALFTLAALLAGPVTNLLGVTGSAATAFQIGYMLTLAPMLTQWLLMLKPPPLNPLSRQPWGGGLLEQWRKGIFATTAFTSLLLFTIALFILAPKELRPALRAASPLAPALSQMESAPLGWFITDSHQLWEQSVSLGIGNVIPYVVSRNNLEALRSELLAAPAPIWVLQSQSDNAPLLLEPLLADFFPADEQLLDDGTRLRPFVSRLDAPITPISGTFTDGITLTKVRLPATIQPGSLLAVELHWQESAGKQKLFLHLIAPDGSLASQRDTLPSATPNRHALILPPTLKPGTYTLLAGRYDPETGERVPLTQGGDTIMLGEVKIEQ